VAALAHERKIGAEKTLVEFTVQIEACAVLQQRRDRAAARQAGVTLYIYRFRGACQNRPKWWPRPGTECFGPS